jgi:type II secretory pathway component PulF
VNDRFRYRAATPQGQILEGVLEAPSRNQALEELRNQRLYPVSVEAAPSAVRKTRRRVGRRAAVTWWTRDAATLLEAGLPLDRMLPAVLVAMVEAGEASGALETVFEEAAAHLEESAELRSQVQSSLLYPALMAVVASIGVAVLLLFVVPRFSVMLEEVGGRLPLTTQLLVTGSELLAGWWWLWLGLVLAVGYGGYRAFQSPATRRRWHAARLGLPWAGDLELKYVTARFARTLGILLKSGVAIVPALRIARSAVGNAVIGEGLASAAKGVAEGSALAPALSGTLPPLALQMIAVGEESGRLDDLCLRVANTYDGEVRRALRTLVSMIEPAMILIFGALVGFVALAMLQAIYSINTTAF